MEENPRRLGLFSISFTTQDDLRTKEVGGRGWICLTPYRLCPKRFWRGRKPQEVKTLVSRLPHRSTSERRRWGGGAGVGLV